MQSGARNSSLRALTVNWNYHKVKGVESVAERRVYVFAAERFDEVASVHAAAE